MKLSRFKWIPFYSNLDLAERNRFWLSNRGFDRLEGCYSDGKGTCTFNAYPN